jgi:ribosomal protein L32
LASNLPELVSAHYKCGSFKLIHVLSHECVITQIYVLIDV